MNTPARTQRLSSKLLRSAADKGGAALAAVQSRAEIVLERQGLARLAGTELCDEAPAKHFCVAWCCKHCLFGGKFSADVFRAVYPIVARREWVHCLKIAVASLAVERLPLLLELNQRVLGWSGAAEPMPRSECVDAEMNPGWTALHHAVTYGVRPTTDVDELRQIIGILQASGANLNQADSYGVTPLAQAKKHSAVWVPVLLSEMGASATP